MQDRIIDFLLRAKRATYAGKGAETAPSRPDSHDLQYIEGELLYIDTYLGGERFAGEEALWNGNIPFWAMNYAGKVIAQGFSGDFLKEALLAVQSEKPYRGPDEYTDGRYIYKCEVDGDFEWFNGIEEIYKGGVKIYECLFHGGLIR